MEHYPAVLRKTSSSHYGVEFPDLPGCFSAGRTLKEAQRMAAEALRLHLDGIAEDGRVPPPSSLDAVERRLQAHHKRATAHRDFFAVVLIEADPAVEHVARINVTMEERLLRAVDQAARARGESRSGFLAHAARAAMALQRRR